MLPFGYKYGGGINLPATPEKNVLLRKDNTFSKKEILNIPLKKFKMVVLVLIRYLCFITKQMYQYLQHR